ncbi:MAG: response regulator [Dehalococcoidia bacterium]
MSERLPRLLLLDGDAAAQRAVAADLRRVGFAVTEMHEWRAAIEAVRSTDVPCDLIVIDPRFPDIGATGLIRALSREGRVPGPSIVILSSLDRPDEVVRMLQAGADAFVGKPVLLESLRDVVFGLLREREAAPRRLMRAARSPHRGEARNPGARRSFPRVLRRLGI